MAHRDASPNDSTEQQFSADELRDSMFSALCEGNDELLISLCRENQALIVEHFEYWKNVPEHVRLKPGFISIYASFLSVIAEIFSHILHNPGLLQKLQGSREENPIIRWKENIDRCRELLDVYRYEEALPFLETLLSSFRQMSGPAVESFLPLALGMKGECLFQMGVAQEAIPVLEESLTLCDLFHDDDGSISCLGNLYHASRYAGDGQRAADYGDRLVEYLDRLGEEQEARQYRKRLALVRQGEPLLRVVAIINERFYEMDDIPADEKGGILFVYERNRLSLRRASNLTQEGVELVQGGKPEEALVRFSLATRADPYDPAPWFHQGNAMLYLSDCEEAIRCFQEADLLAPGWNSCHTDIWLAEQLKAGTITHSDFLSLRRIESQKAPFTRLQMTGAALMENPTLAPLYFLNGESLFDLGKEDEARLAYERGLHYAEDEGTRTRLLLKCGMLETDREKKERFLRQAAELQGDLLNAAMASYLLRKA